MIYISLGPNCHAAGNLRFLKLRNISLPFDWLMTDEIKGIEYVNDLIKTNFINFVNNLKLIGSKKVISENYPYSQFVHHNLIKNTYTPIGDYPENDLNLIETFKMRAQRFMDIINDSNNECTFLYGISYDVFCNENLFQKILNDLHCFENEIMVKFSKCSYKLIIYILCDIKTYNEIELKEHCFKNIVIKKYFINMSVDRIYGNPSDFKELLS